MTARPPAVDDTGGVDDADDVRAGNPAATTPPQRRRAAAQFVFTLSCISLAAVGAAAWFEPWQARQSLVLARGSGWVACGALLLSLSISPLSRLASVFGVDPRWSRGAPLLRRALGMASAWLALVHAVVSLLGPLAGDLTAVGSWPHLRAGATALGILLVLLATSFGAVVARLRLSMFRELHRLAFIAALAILQHLLLSTFASRQLVLGLFGATLLLGLLRLRARPRLRNP